jgi:N-acetylglucosaminyl-diphospho-decaprenol L-rhamnosyltransferase
MNIKLSVIIVNWNVCELLGECLSSLYQQTRLPPQQFEVFVVDNNSSDNSVEMVRERFPQVNLVANTNNVGFGKANNQVLSRCRGNYILLLNPDTIVIEHAVERFLEHAERNPDVAAWGCRLLNLDGSLQRWTGGSFPNISNIAAHYLFINKLPGRKLASSLYLETDVKQDIEVDWVSGACMLLKTASLEGKLFNEAFFMYGEDMELCHRLKNNGGRIVYTPAVSIIHIQGASMKKQEGVILLSSLKGLRSFYEMIHGSGFLWAVDALTILGFAVRWLLYSLANILKPDAGYAEKAKSSVSYIKIATRIMKRA